MEVKEIKEKMEQAWNLMVEVTNETEKLNNTDTNKQIASLMRSFGKSHFLEHVSTMKLWIDDLEA